MAFVEVAVRQAVAFGKVGADIDTKVASDVGKLSKSCVKVKIKKQYSPFLTGVF